MIFEDKIWSTSLWIGRGLGKKNYNVWFYVDETSLAKIYVT